MAPHELNTYWDKEEEENSKKGLIGSLIFHVILLMIILVPWFKTLDPPPAIPGVLISLDNIEPSNQEQPSSSSSQAIVYQNEESSASPADIEESSVESKHKEQESKPKAASAEPNAKLAKEVPAKFVKRAEDVQEISPITIKEDKEQREANELNAQEIKRKEQRSKELADSKKKKLEEEKAAAARQAQQKAEAQAEAKRKRMEEAARKKQEAYERTKSELSGLFEGDVKDGESAGKKASTADNSDAEMLNGLSSDAANVGGGLSGRGVIYEPKIEENSQKTGKVVVKVCVDRSGSVITSKYTQRGSTTTDSELVQVAEKAAAKYKFSKGDLEEQCGTITIDFMLR